MIKVKIDGAEEVYEFDAGLPAGAALAYAGISDEGLAAVHANNELVSLARPLEVDTVLRPLPLDSHLGQAIYRQTLSFALAAAAEELTAEGVLPRARLCIGHSLGYSYYYYFTGASITAAHIAALEARMRLFVDDDRLVYFEWMSYTEADAYFRAHDRDGTAALLALRDKWRIPVYRSGDYIELYHNTLLPRLGMLSVFALEAYEDGFLLRFPATSDPKRLGDYHEQEKIFQVYKEYKKWGRIEGVHSAPALNECIAKREIRDFIRIAEAFHAKKLSEIADKIYERREDIRVVLIAGPSSSGKTTTAKRLSIELEVLGLKPQPLSLDNYYNPPAMAPKDEDGNPDLEAIEALDVAYLNDQLVDLLDGKEVVTPMYDFKKGCRVPGATLKLGRRSVLVVEGIHGLNDALTPHIPPERKYKLYVSALTQLNIDDMARVPTSDNRLLRRIVRDYQFRAASAERSIAMWPSVRRGEEKNIFPFQNSADAIFNSALDYELSVLKFYAEPLLRIVPPTAPEYGEAVRLLAFLANFMPVPPTYIPPLSILREFIGGSDFKY